MEQKEVMWYSLGNILEDYIQKSNPSFYYLKLVKDNWKIILGEPLYKKIVPYCWKNRTLILTAKDSSYIFFVKMKMESIASQVRAVLQNDYCRKIEVKKIN